MKNTFIHKSDLEAHLWQLIAIDEEEVGLPAWEAVGCALHGAQRRLQDVDPVDLRGVYNLPAKNWVLRV